jgi:hypothetical protein
LIQSTIQFRASRFVEPPRLVETWHARAPFEVPVQVIGPERFKLINRALEAYDCVQALELERAADGGGDPPAESLLRRRSCHSLVQSDLFLRLLSGQPPLVRPPPRSFGRKWYALVEEPGPHRPVRVQLPPPASAEGTARTHSLRVNGHAYRVVRANPPAVALLAACVAIERHHRRKSLKSEVAHLWREALAAYAAAPRMWISDAAWPAWVLHTDGAFASLAQPTLVETIVARQAAERGRLSPLDLDPAWVDPSDAPAPSRPAAAADPLAEEAHRIIDVFRGGWVKALPGPAAPRQAPPVATGWHVARSEHWPTTPELYLRVTR